MEISNAKLVYEKGYKYQIVEDFKVQLPLTIEKDIEIPFASLSKDGLLWLKPGFAYDGASGPTKDSKANMRGSGIHDALYKMMRLELLSLKWRPLADKLLKEYCIADTKKGYKWAARIRYKAWEWSVGKFARKSATYEGKRKRYIAP